MNKIYIITIVNKHEDFIRLQYESIIKHIKGNYEYIVFSNGSNETQNDKIKQICDELKINCIKICVNYNATPSYIAGEALNQCFKHLHDKQVFKIDSDMFFISDLNLFDLCNTNDLVYIETQTKYMWSGVFGINMKKIKDITLNFNPHVIPFTDTFGQSCLLTNNINYSRKKMFLFCILTNINNEINGSINNDCRIILNDYKLTFNENNLYEELYKLLPLKYLEINKNMINYNFPDPYHIDIITIDNVDAIIHFKSSNHDNIYHDLIYTENKKASLIAFLKNN